MIRMVVRSITISSFYFAVIMSSLLLHYLLDLADLMLNLNSIQKIIPSGNGCFSLRNTLEERWYDCALREKMLKHVEGMDTEPGEPGLCR
jgi:hypothetical protein